MPVWTLSNDSSFGRGKFWESKSGARGRPASYEKRPDQRMQRENVARATGSFLRGWLCLSLRRSWLLPFRAQRGISRKRSRAAIGGAGFQRPAVYPCVRGERRSTASPSGSRAGARGRRAETGSFALKHFDRCRLIVRILELVGFDLVGARIHRRAVGPLGVRRHQHASGTRKYQHQQQYFHFGPLMPPSKAYRRGSMQVFLPRPL